MSETNKREIVRGKKREKERKREKEKQSETLFHYFCYLSIRLRFDD